MGEMADYFLDSGDWAPLGPSKKPNPPLAHACRYCGQGGMHWQKTDRGWRLGTVTVDWEKGYRVEVWTVHVCPIRPAPEHTSG